MGKGRRMGKRGYLVAVSSRISSLEVRTTRNLPEKVNGGNLKGTPRIFHGTAWGTHRSGESIPGVGRATPLGKGVMDFIGYFGSFEVHRRSDELAHPHCRPHRCLSSVISAWWGTQGGGIAGRALGKCRGNAQHAEGQMAQHCERSSRI